MFVLGRAIPVVCFSRSLSIRLTRKKEGCMQKTQPIYPRQHEEVETRISHPSLPGLLPPDRILALNPETRTLSFLAAGPLLIKEQQLSANELNVIVPILEYFPHCCPYEVLLAHISSNTVTAASIERCRQRLQEALSRGAWQQELRPIRRALSSLRNKLHRFNLEISNVRERGCSLTSLASTAVADSDDCDSPKLGASRL